MHHRRRPRLVTALLAVPVPLVSAAAAHAAIPPLVVPGWPLVVDSGIAITGDAPQVAHGPGGSVYVLAAPPGRTAWLRAIARDGTPLWQYVPPRGRTLRDLVVEDGGLRLVERSAQGSRIVALTTDGRVRWRSAALPGAVAVAAGPRGTIAVTNGRVVETLRRDGRPLWRVRASNRVVATAGRRSEIAVAATGRVYVTAETRANTEVLVAYSRTGRPLWARSLEGSFPLADDLGVTRGGAIRVGAEDRGDRVYTPAGRPVGVVPEAPRTWRLGGGGATVRLVPPIGDSSTGRLRATDARGSLLWERPVTDEPLVQVDRAGTVYVASGGRLAALGRDGATLWRREESVDHLRLIGAGRLLVSGSDTLRVLGDGGRPWADGSAEGSVVPAASIVPARIVARRSCTVAGPGGRVLRPGAGVVVSLSLPAGRSVVFAVTGDDGRSVGTIAAGWEGGNSEGFLGFPAGAAVTRIVVDLAPIRERVDPSARSSCLPPGRYRLQPEAVVFREDDDGFIYRTTEALPVPSIGVEIVP